MFEKVNPMHPDKVADRIAGAIVDYAYTMSDDPKIAVEVLIGHGVCHIIAECSPDAVPPADAVRGIVSRISGEYIDNIIYEPFSQDVHLANNQVGAVRCGDNGIFRGMPVTKEQALLSTVARDIYSRYPTDGKYVLDGDKFIICQSQATNDELKKMYPAAIINPLGEWRGGTYVDTGATNRKLGSDMADSITGGGLHGKDLSKADVSVNIYAFLKAQQTGKPVEISCAIGDQVVDGVPYYVIVEDARRYIKDIGGFEKFAEWGLL